MIPVIAFWAFQITNFIAVVEKIVAKKIDHGALLLAVSIYLLTIGSGQREGYLLMAYVCGVSFVAHLVTWRRLRNAKVVATDLVVGSLAIAAYYSMP